jgi:transcription initiation factor TFIIA large subunit
VGNSQVDGPGFTLDDWKAEAARRREEAQQHGAQNDCALRDFVASRALAMEGGGLPAPLNERYPRPSQASRNPTNLENQLGVPASPDSNSTGGVIPARYDGPDDDGQEEDEDAINSDLDDPDDLLDDDPENEDSVGQVMLCTYDKVQHVKSRWKCTLKDGILAINGKECVTF